MVGGAGLAYQELFSDFDVYYEMLKSFIKSKTDKVFESYGVKVVVPFSSYVYMMGLEL